MTSTRDLKCEGPNIVDFIRETLDPNMPKGWDWSYMGGRKGLVQTLVRGGVPTTYVRGPKAGKPNWDGRNRAHDREYYIDYAKFRAMREAWEADELRQLELREGGSP